MNKKLLLLIGLILLGWASCEYLNFGFSAAEKERALMALGAYIALKCFVRFKFRKASNVLISPLLVMFAGAWVIYTPYPSPTIDWLEGIAGAFRLNYDMLEKVLCVSSVGILVIGVNFALDCMIFAARKRKGSALFILASQTLVIVALIYNMFAITTAGKTENEHLAKVTRTAVSWFAKASPEQDEASENKFAKSILAAKNERWTKYAKGKTNLLQEIGPDFDVRLDTSPTRDITADDLEHFLRGVLVGKSEQFIEAAMRHNLDPVFLTSIALHESTCGTSVIAKAHNNPLGVMCGAEFKTPRDFESVDDAIEHVANRLENSGLYIKGGNCTVEAIQKVYCPVGASNDPKKLNKHWLPGVLSWMNKIQTQAWKRSQNTGTAPEMVAKN